MKNNAHIVYGIKVVGARVYVTTDDDINHFVTVLELKNAMYLKDRAYAQKICNDLNSRKLGYSFEVFKAVNPFTLKNK